jgi:pimeloyl-ACP methyl ester carboxylesterase
VLNILPVNGTYHEWQQGEGLNGVAQYYGVTPEDIINYPPNELDAATVGDYANPNIQPGTWLVVPNGRREFVSWSAPLGVTRENPASARVLGAGACGSISGGAVGFGTFVWPSPGAYPPVNLPVIKAIRGIDLSGTSRKTVEESLSETLDKATTGFLLKNLYWRNDVLAWRFNISTIEKNIDQLGNPLPENLLYSGPALFLRGKNSDYIKDADKPLILHHFPKAALQTIPDAGHWIHADNPADFKEAVLDFLKRD